MTESSFRAQLSTLMSRARMTIKQAMNELETVAQEAEVAGQREFAKAIRSIGNNLDHVAEMRLKPHGPICDHCDTKSDTGPAKAITPAGHPQTKGL